MSSSQSISRSERLALVALMRKLGPAAPTLCEGWDTADLAVHLVVRDRKPVAAVGSIAPTLAERFPALRTAAEDTSAELHALPFPELIGLVAAGAPKWSPAGWKKGDELVNTVEFLIHHEDVRRAQPDWAPRKLSYEAQQAAFRAAVLMLAPAAVKARRHLVIDAIGFGRKGAGRVSQGTRTISGQPLEILLYLSGRQDVARVEISETAGGEPVAD